MTDPTSGWRPQPPDALLRVVRFGSCEMRSMDRGHGVSTEVGYPAEAVRRLGRHGVTTEWQNVFCLSFEALPVTGAGLIEHLRLTGRPHIVLVQLGAIYMAWHVLPQTGRAAELRNRLARDVPPSLAWAHYGMLDALLPRRARRFRQYHGVERLGEFIASCRREWPSARLIVELPYETCSGSAWKQRMIARVRRDVAAVAAAHRVEVLDHQPLLGHSRQLRCPNGYNLNTRGSQVVGRAVADRLLQAVGEPTA